MSLNDSGFFKETPEESLSRIVSSYTEAIPDIALDPSNPVYQWMKIQVLETQYLQTLIDQAFANMTVLGAGSDSLDKHAIEAGLFRKDAVYANGYVQCIGTYPNTIPAETVFSTTNQIHYYVYETMEFTQQIKMTRSSGTIDYIPSTYTGITLSGLTYDYSGTSVVDPTGYSFADDVITWSDTGSLSYSTTYYAVPSGSYGINTPIIAEISGTSGNTAANTIIVNTNNITIDSVNNAVALTNGLDQESDSDLRYRILSAKRKATSLGKINSTVQQLEGVMESHTYQNMGTDLSNLSDWNDVDDWTGGTTYTIEDNTGTIGFTFVPSDGIATLQGITLYGRATGLAGDIEMYMTNHGSGEYTDDTDQMIARVTIDRSVLIDANDNQFQDITFPIKYNGLDTTKTYRIYIHAKGLADSSNYFEFVAMTGLATGNYRMDYFVDNTGSTGTGLIRKTKYGIPGYTIVVRPEEGYDYEDIEDSIRNLIDYQDGDGYGPICIQSIIKEATKVYIGISVTIYIMDDYIFSEVSARLKENIRTYLKTLRPGDNVSYSQIERTILNTNGIWKERLLKINVDGNSWSTRDDELDVPVGNDEYAVLDIDSVYSGIAITEG